MNKKITVAVTLLIAFAGLAVAVQNTQEAQLFDGNRMLNSVYATDGEGNYIGIMFTDNESQIYSNIDSPSEFESDSIDICRQYIKEGGFLRGERTSEVECSPLTVQNQSMSDIMVSSNLQTNQDRIGAVLTQYQGNGTVSPPKQIPDLFRATDADRNSMVLIIDNRGEVYSIIGNINSVDDLDRESTRACEYYFQLNILDFDNPSEINCFGYSELQDRIRNGSITYLPLNDQTARNESLEN